MQLFLNLGKLIRVSENFVCLACTSEMRYLLFETFRCELHYTSGQSRQFEAW